jgi:hypothetical protein
MISKTFRLVSGIACFLAPALEAQITYVDATTSNVTRVDGNPFAPVATGNIYNDSNWSLRTGLASGSSIFEGGGGEAVPMLKQTLTGVAAGYYDVYVFFWVANNVNWQINAGLTASTTHFGSVGTNTTPVAVTSLASSATYSAGAAPTVFAELDRTMIRAKLGQATVTAGGTIEVFVTSGAMVNSNTTNSRTWFDGIGYGPYEPPPPPPGDGVEIAPDGAWTWFNDERSIIHQGSLFSGYVKGNGSYGITRRDLATGQNHHMTISTASSQQQDDHNNPSITVLPDGKLMILYSKHIAGAVFYQRTSTVPLPSTNADWGPEITRTVPAANTYANTYLLSAESNAIYNFHRCINFNPTLTISMDNGATWGTSRQLLGTGSGSTRPYPRYTSNGTDRIDLIYTDGHPRDVANSVYHLYYQNGGLYKTDGTLIDSLANIPLDHDAGERGNVIYQYSAAAWGPGDGPDNWIPAGRGWTWDVAYGQRDLPTCVFQVQKDDVTGSGWNNDRIYYYYARWTGTAWQRKFIAHAGRPLYSAEDDYGGGMCLDPEDPRVVYISTNAADPFAVGDITNVPLRANNRYEIYRGFTADGGLTFAWTQITVNSAADNLRPIVPMNHGRSEFLIWFHGTYSTYTNFATKVLARHGAPQTAFDSWSDSYSLPATTPLDSDGDGIDNLVEFAVGGDPKSAASRPLPVWQDGAFTFPWPENLAGIEWHVQESDNLSDWETVATLRGGTLPSTVSAGFQLSSTLPNRHATVVPTGISPPRRFMRLKIATTE